MGIPYGSMDKHCPVGSLQAWLKTARIVDSPVFRFWINFSECRRGGCRLSARLDDARAAELRRTPERPSIEVRAIRRKVGRRVSLEGVVLTIAELPGLVIFGQTAENALGWAREAIAFQLRDSPDGDQTPPLELVPGRAG